MLAAAIVVLMAGVVITACGKDDDDDEEACYKVDYTYRGQNQTAYVYDTKSAIKEEAKEGGVTINSISKTDGSHCGM